MPIHLPGFVEFNCRKWGLRALPFEYPAQSAGPPRLKGNFYLDRSGRVAMPKVCAYLPVQFDPSPTEKPYRLTRQWTSLAKMMAADMKRLGLASIVNLPPDITDIRPWAWAGFRTLVGYTLRIDFPWNLDQAAYSVRKDVAKAIRAGYVCERSDDVAALSRCLSGTETRQGISYRMSESDLRMALSLIGSDHLRIYLCRSASGEPASGLAVIHVPGGKAIGWLGGTPPSHLSSGANQHLLAYVLGDLHTAAATCFDFGGANIERVAEAKMVFGATLIPFYRLQLPTLTSLALDTLQWLRGMVPRRA